MPRITRGHSKVQTYLPFGMAVFYRGHCVFSGTLV